MSKHSRQAHLMIEMINGKWFFSVSRPKDQYLLYFTFLCIKKQKQIRERTSRA